MKYYVVPRAAARLNERHDILGPYSHTPSGHALAADVAANYQVSGIDCTVIASATRPVLNNLPRGLRAEILTGPYNSANGGISETHKFVTLIISGMPEGDAAYDQYGRFLPVLHAPTQDAPAVELDQTLPGYHVARPMITVDSGNVGWMASGAYIACRDDRFTMATGSDRPIPLHDRTESTELYRLLSD